VGEEGKGQMVGAKWRASRVAVMGWMAGSVGIGEGKRGVGWKIRGREEREVAGKIVKVGKDRGKGGGGG